MGHYKNKIVLVGSYDSGKKFLFRNWISAPFSRDYTLTVGANIGTKQITFPNDNTVTFSIWDIGIQQRFEFVRSSFYKGASGAIIIFDLTRKETLMEAKKWASEIRRFGGNNVVIILIGNKIDLKDQRVIDYNEVQEYLENSKFAAYIETSTKEGINIEESIMLLGEIMLYLHENMLIKSEFNPTTLSPSLKKKILKLRIHPYSDEVLYKHNIIRVKEGILNLKDLKVNDIVKINGLKRLTELEELNLSNNEIISIKGLNTLINLKKLNLTRNDIKEIGGLEKLTNLESLDLFGNQIFKIKGFEHQIKLKELRIGNNPIPQDIIEELGGLDKNGFANIPRKFVENCIERKKQIEKSKNLAEQLLDNEKYIESIDHYQEAIGLDSNDVDVWNNLGINYYFLNKFDKAIECFEKIINMDHEFYHPWYNLGLAYYTKKEYEKAIFCNEKAVCMEPIQLSAWYNLGFCYSLVDNYYNAIRCYKTIVQNNSNDIETWLKLAETYYILENWKDALFSYEKLAELDPTNQDFSQKIKRIRSITLQDKFSNIDNLMKLKKFPDAIKSLKDVLIEAEKYNLENIINLTKKKIALCNNLDDIIKGMLSIIEVNEADCDELFHTIKIKIDEIESTVKNLILEREKEMQELRDSLIREKNQLITGGRPKAAVKMTRI